MARCHRGRHRRARQHARPAPRDSHRSSRVDLTAARRGLTLGDRYRLDLRIAAGGMGEVWAATDTVLDRLVAVKVIRDDLGARPASLERFRREARHLAMVAHPSIPTLFDFGEHDGSPYLVMELVVGEDLARCLARHDPMPIAHVIHVLEQIADGLAVAHDAGLVHRDIKPGNIMITDRGLVKITDFGIARLVDSHALTATGDVLGTPQYMSPEQITGQTASPASDVYCVGLVAYEMLTGHPPFVGDNPMTVALAQLHDSPSPLPATVPRGLATLIERVLDKDPKHRPADAGELGRELRNVDQRAATVTGPTIAFPTELMTRPLVPTLFAPRQPVRTSRHISIAFVALCVVVVVAVVVLGDRLGQGDADLELAVASTTLATASATGPSVTSSSTTSVPASTSPTTPTVLVDPAAFIGRDHQDVVDELRKLGFTVEERRVAADGDKKNTVVAVEPNGALAPGTVIEVQVARPGKAHGNG